MEAEEAKQKAYRPSQAGREFAAEAVLPQRRSTRTRSNLIPNRIGPLFEKAVQKMREETKFFASLPELRTAWRKVLAEMQATADAQEKEGLGKLPYKFDLPTFPLPEVFRDVDTSGDIEPEWKSRIKFTSIFPVPSPRGQKFEPGKPLRLMIGDYSKHQRKPDRPVKPEPSPSPEPARVPALLPPKPKKRAPKPKKRAPPAEKPDLAPLALDHFLKHGEWPAWYSPKKSPERRQPSPARQEEEKLLQEPAEQKEDQGRLPSDPSLIGVFKPGSFDQRVQLALVDAGYENERQYFEESPDFRAEFPAEIAEWEKAHGPLRRVKPEPSPSPEPSPGILAGIARPPPIPEPKPEPPAIDPHAYREPEPAIPSPATTRPGSPQPELDPEEFMDEDPGMMWQPDYGQMPDLERESMLRHIMKLEGAGANYLNPINLTGVPFGMSSHHKTAVVARNVPRRPLFHAEDVNVTDLVHRFQNLEMPSRVHMVQASSHILGHIMHDMWEDVNMGQRRARERHGRTGPFAKRRGRSRVMNKSANVQGRSRGKLYEATIQRKVSQYELEMVMKKLRVHMRSSVGSLLFLHFGKSKKLLGDLTDIDLEELKKMIRRKLQRHSKIGLEVTDARVGGALHNPVTHSPQFTRTLL